MQHAPLKAASLALLFSLAIGCDKPEPTIEKPVEEEVSAPTEAAVPVKETVAEAGAPIKDSVENKPAEELDESVYIEKLERLTETCAKLEQPTHEACTAFQKKIAAKDPAALEDLDTVLNGSRVAQPNMVYLEEKVAAMLVEKYGEAE